jgi:hypothetical protein
MSSEPRTRFDMAELLVAALADPRVKDREKERLIEALDDPGVQERLMGLFERVLAKREAAREAAREKPLTAVQIARRLGVDEKTWWRVRQEHPELDQPPFCTGAGKRRRWFWSIVKPWWDANKPRT